jgi:hypothetical protein
MSGELRVDAAGLINEGQGLATTAAEIPTAPTPTIDSGEDALSAAFAAHLAATVDPVVAARPKTKEKAGGYAKGLQVAGKGYATTDEHGQGQLDRQMPGLGGTTPGAGAGPAAGGSLSSGLRAALDRPDVGPGRGR